MHSNPYDFTKPISDVDLLAGRDRELKEIKYNLDQAITDNPNFYSFALVGKRAAGKSSLLNVTRQLAKERGLLTVKVSLNKEMVSNHLFFYEEIVDGIFAEGHDYGMYRGRFGRIWKRSARTKGSADIEVSLPILKVKISQAKESKEKEISQQYLVHALNESLKEARKQNLKGIVILLDECDLLAHDEALLQKIRNVIQDTNGFIFVFAGTDKMFSAINEVLSPASRSFKRLEIINFKNVEQTRDCILKPLDDSEKKKVDSQCIYEIHYFTGGSPYEITLVSHYMYKKYTETQSDKIQLTVKVLDDIQKEIERLRSKGPHEIASKIKSLWPDYLRVLLALLEFGESNEVALSKYILLDEVETLTPKKAKDKIETTKSIVKHLLESSIIELDSGLRIVFKGDEFDVLYLKYHSLSVGFEHFFVGNKEGPIINLQQRVRNILTAGIRQIEYIVRFDDTHGIRGPLLGKELTLSGRKLIIRGTVNIPIDPERLYFESTTTVNFRINVPYLNSGWVSTYIFDSKEDMNIAVSRLDSLLKKFELAGLEVLNDDEVSMNKRGFQQIQNREYSEAIDCFNQAMKVNPKSERAYYGKALSLFFIENYDESIDNCDMALALVPNWATAMELKGKCFFHKSDYDTALIFFDRALNINPEHWDALDNKGRALLNIGKFEEAASCFEQVVEHQSNRITTLKLYAKTLWELKAFEKALSVLNLILKGQPKDKDVLINKGLVLIDLEQFDDAIEFLSKVAELYSDDSFALVILSVAHLKAGELEEGLEVSERAILLNPDSPGGWYNKACALTRLGKIDSALSALKKSATLSEEVAKQAKHDPDFDAIRENEEFKKIIEE